MSHHHRTLIDSSSSSSSTASAIGSLPSLSTLLRNSQTCHNNNPIDNNSNIIKDGIRLPSIKCIDDIDDNYNIHNNHHLQRSPPLQFQNSPPIKSKKIKNLELPISDPHPPSDWSSTNQNKPYRRHSSSRSANSSCSSINGNNGFAEYHQNSDIKISSTSSTQQTQQQKIIPFAIDMNKVTEHCHFIGQHASLFVEFCRNKKFHDDGPGAIADGDKKTVKLEQFSWTTSSPTTATSTASNDIPLNSEQQLVEMVNKTYDMLNILNRVKHYLQKPIISSDQETINMIRKKRTTTGSSAARTKYRKRNKRAAPPGRCHSCNISETPEWRRGPDGARTLCNACGLPTNHHIYVGDNNNNNIQYHSPPPPPHQLPQPHSLSPPPHSYM
ncbi:8028_t:CDS:2 [Entrophospora sp. SA101]|nr:10823_t:CDS:2 [Entrophospora sp. SA101]CAJ0650132.1 11837_t:CDS:2 [Entrophospora sp. SA101]CAJ0766946.1 8028_t:CDS:2 [Entrophospora sp. SA101]CAJ0836091.1 12852_t:CDS:2 [Entrophospora sp. SA101]CAJ0850449.1 21053_t:CDS:2 [Entrophospora sp. SA101]